MDGRWSSSDFSSKSSGVFIKRTVFIKEKNLRELALTLQDRCVEFIKPMLVFDRHSSLAVKEGSVKTIEITDSKEQD